MIKRLVQIGLMFTLLVTLSIVPSFSSKKNTGLEETLDCTNGDISGEGWVYDESDNILTIKDLTINTEDEYGIVVPTGTTIVLQGNLDINVLHKHGNAIYCEGSFSIVGNGDLTIKQAYKGISSSGLVINLDGNIVINSENAISVDSSENIVIKANNLDINDSVYGIYGTGNFDIELDNLHIDASNVGIYVKGEVVMKITEEVIIEIKEVFRNDCIYVSDYLILKGNATITVNDAICAHQVVVLDKVSINGLVSNTDTGQSFIYGKFVPEDKSTYFGKSLSFMTDSLVVVETGNFVSFRDFDTVDTTNMSIINNGLLCVSQVEEFKGIEGLGYLGTYSFEVYEENYYDNDGNSIENILLEDKEESNDLYTWKKNSDGIYVLDLHQNAIGSITIKTKEAIINLQQDTIILSLVSTTKEENSSISVSGDYVLNCFGSILMNPILSTFVVDSDTTVYTKEINVFMDDIRNDMESITFKIEVLGNVITNRIFAHELVVQNKACVEVTTSNLMLLGSDTNKPSLVLGEQLEIISPTNAKIETIEEGSTLIKIILPEGVVLDDNGIRDLGYSIIIGSKQAHTISVTTTGAGLVEGDNIVYDGLNQEYLFTPDVGYEITSVIVDGTDLGAIASYTFEGVVRNHTLEVIFTKIVEDNTDTNVGGSDDENTGTGDDENTGTGTGGDTSTDVDTNVDVDADSDVEVNTDTVSPDTGDTNNVAILCALFIGSIFTLIIGMKKRMKAE